MRVEIDLLDRQPSAEHAAFLVAGIANGCVAFRILGKAVDAAEDGVVTHTPLAMDFGVVPAGTVSAPRKFTFVAQTKTAPEERLTLGSFGVSPSAFSIDGNPGGGVTLTGGSCRVLEVNLRFAAPSTPGLVRGSLTWEFAGPELSALVTIDVLGNSE